MITYHNVKQNTPEWSKLRVGKIGGSTAGRLFELRTGGLKSGWQKYAARVSAEILTNISEDTDYINDAMQWGLDYEREARKSYDEFIGVQVREIGYVTNDQFDYFGFSPDGYIPTGSTQIKCPFNSSEFIWTKHFKNIKPDYKMQCVFEMAIDDSLEVVEFVSYDPRLPKGENITILPLYRKDYNGVIKGMHESMKKFIDSVNGIMDDYA